MKEFLTGPNGEQSSKRLFTGVLMIIYSMVLVVNLFTAKKLDDVLQQQLFYMILTFYGLIAVEGWKGFARTSKPNDEAPK